MENGGANSSWASRIHHIGIVVRDIEKAIEYYESLGIGPFEPLKRGTKDVEPIVYSQNLPGSYLCSLT